MLSNLKNLHQTHVLYIISSLLTFIVYFFKSVIHMPLAEIL